MRQLGISGISKNKKRFQRSGAKEKNAEVAHLRPAGDMSRQAAKFQGRQERPKPS